MRVITYGTFDLFHDGHVRLLERARALGDHLIVAVTTDNYDSTRGKLNVSQSLMERIHNVQKSGLADEVIIEEYEGQKINDIQQHDVDIFAIGSDWLGKFDYLNDYCKVVYLERTKGVSSTQLRDETGILRIGVLGSGRIANRNFTWKEWRQYFPDEAYRPTFPDLPDGDGVAEARAAQEKARHTAPAAKSKIPETKSALSGRP